MRETTTLRRHLQAPSHLGIMSSLCTRRGGLPEFSCVLLKGITVPLHLLHVCVVCSTWRSLAVWEQHMQSGRRMGQQNM